MAVNCAILSYDGMVYFGFSGDAHAAPDLRILQKLLQTSFVEFRDSVGVAPSQKKTAQKKPRQKSRVNRAGATTGNSAVGSVPVTKSWSLLDSKRQPEPTLANEQENPREKVSVA
jgi:hypothetical protein